MTKKTIEVPIELIERGDIAGLRKLLPQDYFGRWATHIQYGRVLITSKKESRNKMVSVIYRDDRILGGVNTEVVCTRHLTLDPAELTTIEDFAGAPEGTIITHRDYLCHEKNNGYWWAGDTRLVSEELEMMGTWQVLRWGDNA